jgi:PAS domain S-box-containing protein
MPGINFSALESKTRLAAFAFALALLLTIGLNLALYLQSSSEISSQQMNQLRLEADLISYLLPEDLSKVTESTLREILQRNAISATVAIYSPDQKRIIKTSSIGESPETSRLLPDLHTPKPPDTTAGQEPHIRREGNHEVAEKKLRGSATLVLVKPRTGTSYPITLYALSYQLVALIFGFGLAFLVVRWLLRPYRRIVKAAQASPVHPSSSRNESEFVVETFQALIKQLQAKERELAELHSLEKRRAERSERFSERLIANIPSGLVSVDFRGIVTSANPPVMELLGHLKADTSSLSAAAAAIIGATTNFKDFLNASPRMIELISDCLRSGKSYKREVVDITHSDGNVRHLGLSISPILDSSAKPEGALCLMTDLTEVIDLRERMKLQENLANLGEMAAGLAHEFKNSLATIQGYIQLIEIQDVRSTTKEERNQTLQATLNEVRLLARLVTDFLNFARPQSLSFSDVDLRSLVDDCITEVKPLLMQSGIRLNLKGEFPVISGDEILLRRSISNLIRNAAEAIDPQSPLRQIEITCSLDTGKAKQYAHLRIRDTGHGIAPEDMNRIFIPFFTTKSRGYGIGLAIVQKIIMAHGGSVTVEKSDNSGTIFHCRLPL